MEPLSETNQPIGTMFHDLLDLGVLVEELRDQGVETRKLLDGTDLAHNMFSNPDIRITTIQKLRILGNARMLASEGDFALRAGARQRISNYGIYGYAMATMETFRQSLDFGFRFLPLSGTLLTINRRFEGNDCVFVSLEPERLGDLLPVVAEFWRASMHGLLSHILEAPFPHTMMLFPYKAPPHWRAYKRLFGCPVHFSQECMEWHFDASVLERRNPNYNPITATTCERICERLLYERSKETKIVSEIQARVMNSPHNHLTASEMAMQLGISVRTLHRTLRKEGSSYKAVVDDVRKSISIEFLSNTKMPIEEIAIRIGFRDTSNFRKAFKRWTGATPSNFRND